MSSDLNNKQFQVKAEYEKTSTNTKYSATSPMITISVNNATFSITGGQVDMIGKEEEPGQASSA
ncbi:MAG: hypothetical protein MJ233_00935 [Mycoplasmoidaceae bacterium]|nr:hypothetical protein [Mycoplasmoidaceae bacterium]